MPRMGPRGNGKIEKSKDFKGTLIKTFNNLGKWKYVLIFALGMATLSAILALVAPNKLSDLTDEITLGITPNITENIIKDIMTSDDVAMEDKMALQSLIADLEDSGKELDDILLELDNLPDSIYSIIKPKMNMVKIKNMALVLAIIYILSSIFSYIESILTTIIANKYAYKLRRDISKKINKLPLRYFDSHETGDVLSRVTNDIDTVSQTMNNTIASLVSSITLLIGSIIMMFVTNWQMALTAIISSLFGFMFMAIILSKSQRYFTQRQVELGNLNAHIEEIYSGHSVVKVYNADIEAMEEFDKLNKNLYVCNKKSQFLSGIMQPLMGFIGNFSYLAVCVIGAILVSEDIITFGVIVAFMIYVRLFTNPLTRIAQSMTQLQSMTAAGERVFEFLEETEMPDESNLVKKLDRESVKGEIVFKDVKFGYDKNRTIIKNFNAMVKPGQKIAIVGPTGAGKTTLVNLLMKFYDINDGDIIIDGVSTKNLTRENIHDLFIMVLQDTWLFEGTIRDNLKFNKKNVTDEEIMKVCKTVGVDHFIKTLPGGLDANVGDNDTISQGQKQLLTIARGMIENAPFLILDEATSNVDTRTEELVQKAMDKLTSGRTSFIIAHRLSTIKNADLILVMKDGNIIEQGSHDILLKKNGFYAELYNSQFDTIAE
ncbi:MAG: ABC transporter ATP-binding protein [Bacilli bacterium]